MVMKTWVVVLIKDFDTAKQRLQPAMGAKSRRALARRNARRAVAAAAAGARVLVVAGGQEVAEMARASGPGVLGDPREEGQNQAARHGTNPAAERGPPACVHPLSNLPPC